MSRNAAALKREDQFQFDSNNAQDGERADAFARDLTDLCLKHGIGVAVNTALFVMEPEDRHLQYVVNQEGILILS